MSDTGKTHSSEECDSEDIDEDEHLFQFAINFARTNSGAVKPVSGAQIDDYASSDEEQDENGHKVRKPNPLRRHKAEVDPDPDSKLLLEPQNEETTCAKEISLIPQQEQIVKEVMDYAKVGGLNLLIMLWVQLLVLLCL